MTTAALLLAAGAGERLGLHPVPKALAMLGGRSMLEHSLRAMAASGAIDGVVLVVPPAMDASSGAVVEEAVQRYGVAATVLGGPTRQDSVRCGLEAVPPDVDVIVCHDAARPFASPELYRRVLGALEGAEGAVPLIPSPDTVKAVSDGRVERTVPRGTVRLAQTPQAFGASVLRQVHRQAEGSPEPVTDDAALVEGAGFRVVAVEGDPANFKITTMEDLGRAEFVLSRRAEGWTV